MARRRGIRRPGRLPRRGEAVDADRLRELIAGQEAGSDEPLCFEGLRVRGELDLSRRRLDFGLALLDCEFDTPPQLTELAVRSLDLSGSRMPALYADRLAVDGELLLRGAWLGRGDGTESRPLSDPTARASGTRGPRRVWEGLTAGVLQLADARIAGNLVLVDLRVTEDSLWSLLAPRLSIGGSLHARQLRSSGALYLRDARVAYSVNLNGAEVGGLDATELVCGGGLYADWGFRSTGQVLLRAAEVSGVATFHDSVLTGPAGSLHLSRLRVPRLRLDLREPPAGPVVLQDATVDVLVDSAETWPAAGELFLEGFTYKRLESAQQVDVRSRIGWITRDARVGAGSFEQLAKAYESGGDERAARTVRHARERQLRRHDRLTGRVWGVVQDMLFGYGYAPRRALVWLLSLAAAGSLWFAHHQPRPVGGNGQRAWDPVLYSLDLLIPVASLGYRGSWDPAGVDKAVAVVLVVSGWVLATAVIAGARRVLGRG
ncbi:hypothetical protein [Streptomyces sp. GQFP]|uniref:hypothetical protein n=1 Tax=Streptomyces sp. GQFP TaxID=2907545 RepID=UPI001F34C039|nr:hypothetical protein [Streptomyces sp. GQFP]UIX29941.1 hypothetical protein LUX31_07780 [Streptomyces sp. GQFP]